MSVLMLAWAIAFAITSWVEVPIHARALAEVRVEGRAEGESVLRWSRSSRLVLAFAASALTHPFVYFGFPRWLGRMDDPGCLLAAESFAVLVEAWWLHRLGLERRDALLWSLVANASSVAVASTLRCAGIF